jgi:hypothetical protein
MNSHCPPLPHNTDTQDIQMLPDACVNIGFAIHPTGRELLNTETASRPPLCPRIEPPICSANSTDISRSGTRHRHRVRNAPSNREVEGSRRTSALRFPARMLNRHQQNDLTESLELDQQLDAIELSNQIDVEINSIQTSVP